MAETNFHSTRRGSKFYDFDIPKLTEQLERIANALEGKNKIEEIIRHVGSLRTTLAEIFITHLSRHF